MYQTDTNTRLALNGSVQTHYIRGKCGGLDFNGNPDILAGSFRISNQMCEATSINLGGTYIGQMNLTFTTAFANNRGGWVGKTITAEIGIAVGDSITWIPVPGGVYTIRDATWTQDGLQVVAYDNMSKLDKKVNMNNTSGRAYDFLSAAARACGVPLGMSEIQVAALPNGDEVLGLYPTDAVITWRDLLSKLAQVLCCFVTVNRNGALILKKFPSVVNASVNTIDINHRYTGASFSDFETFYTEISVTDMKTNESKNYSVGSNGLRMEIGANPFLQYGLEEEKDKVIYAMLRELSEFAFTPFSCSTLMDPTYDLGDPIRFTGGIAGECVGVVMSYNIDINTLGINGFGENPAISNARTEAEKETSGAYGNSVKQTIQYFTYTNVDRQVIGSSRTQIASVAFVSLDEANLTLWLEIDPEIVLSDPTAELRFTYMLDDEEILYHPIHTIGENGKHIIGLNYFILNYEANKIGRFEIYLEATGGTATLEPDTVHFSLSGQGLAVNKEWDGKLSFTERFNLELGRTIEVPYFEVTASVSIDGVLAPEFNETLSLELGRSMGVSFNDEFEVLGLLDLYDISTEDELNTFITEDNESLIVTEYTRDFINKSSEE